MALVALLLVPLAGCLAPIEGVGIEGAEGRSFLKAKPFQAGSGATRGRDGTMVERTTLDVIEQGP